MKCESVREAISALLDGEPAGVALSDVDDHLASCRSCRAWRSAAHEVTRRSRLVPAASPGRSTDELVAAVFAQVPGSPRPSRLLWARWGLVAVACAQLVVTVPLLLLGRDHNAPAHVAHEMGSFDMALAVGFLVAAWRPERARGMRALVGATAVLLVVTAVLDVLGGRTSLGDEAPHLLTVAGWLLILYVAAASPPERVEPTGSATLRLLHGRSSTAPSPVRGGDGGAASATSGEHRPGRAGEDAADGWRVG